MKKRRFLSFLFVCVLSLSLSVPAFASEGFTDVSDNAYYAEAIKWALANGITEGMGNNKFGVGRNVTRAEAVTFLWRSAGRPTPKGTGETFKDLDPKQTWYHDAVRWAVEQGITNGVGKNQFNPNGSVTNQEMITFLYRTKGGTTQSGPQWYVAAEQWATSKGLLAGVPKQYIGTNQCPREDVVQYLYLEMKSNSGDQGTQTQNTQQPTNVGKNAHEVPGSVDPEDGYVYTYTPNPAYDDGRGGSYDAWIDQKYARCEGLYSKAELRKLHPDYTQGQPGEDTGEASNWTNG